ncbi:MAG: hypothetical protein ACYC8T_34395 [Myxococcaceae bacterium]
MQIAGCVIAALLALPSSPTGHAESAGKSSTAAWFGARAGFAYPIGENPWSYFTDPGFSLEADLGLELSPVITAYGFFEKDLISATPFVDTLFGGQRDLGFIASSTHLLGLGVRRYFAEQLVLVDLALGYRWLGLTWQDERATVFGNTVPELRVGLGMELELGASPALDLAVVLSGSVGGFGWGGVSTTVPIDTAHFLVLLCVEAHFAIPLGGAGGG